MHLHKHLSPGPREFPSLSLLADSTVNAHVACAPGGNWSKADGLHLYHSCARRSRTMRHICTLQNKCKVAALWVSTVGLAPARCRAPHQELPGLSLPPLILLRPSLRTPSSPLLPLVSDSLFNRCAPASPETAKGPQRTWNPPVLLPVLPSSLSLCCYCFLPTVLAPHFFPHRHYFCQQLTVKREQLDEWISSLYENKDDR